MPVNIVDGVDSIIDQALSIVDIGKAPHYKHRESCVSLKSNPPSFDAFNLICQIYDQIERNFKDPDNRFHSSGPSEKNWRFEKILNVSTNNYSKEKTLEKTIAEITSSDWVNQVPTASGIINSASDKLRNIDLVRRLKPGFYEFIELKIDSDTPLFAAFEIMVNGLIYLLSRENYVDKGFDTNELLNAKEITLQILAPKNYYARCHLAWLEKELNCGISKFLTEKFGGRLKASFVFTSFPENFMWPCEDRELLSALDKRSAVTWS